MTKYWKYLKYLIRHKWFVLLQCWERGLYWRGIVHDWHKFLPDEFIPYARYFHGDIRRGRKDGYYKPTDTGDAAFERAWLLHVRRSFHHWQCWAMPTYEGVKLYKMPYYDILEMVADWAGAGQAQNSELSPNQWYEKNKEKLLFEVTTRRSVEAVLRHFYD